MVAVCHQKESDLTAAQLRDALSYDSETGIFRWRHDRAALARAGQEAGNTSHSRGYRMIRVNYHRYVAHRLAWLYVYGVWPVGEVDHINGKTDDNSIANLRIATRQQNCWNGAAKSNNAFGVRNVRKRRKRFEVHFARGNKRLFRRSYPTLDAAIIVRNIVAARLHGQFSSVNR